LLQHDRLDEMRVESCLQRAPLVLGLTITGDGDQRDGALLRRAESSANKTCERSTCIVVVVDDQHAFANVPSGCSIEDRDLLRSVRLDSRKMDRERRAVADALARGRHRTLLQFDKPFDECETQAGFF
jgi:hypothetical protein